MFLNTFHREHILLKLKIKKLLRKIKSKNLTTGVFFCFFLVFSKNVNELMKYSLLIFALVFGIKYFLTIPVATVNIIWSIKNQYFFGICITDVHYLKYVENSYSVVLEEDSLL